jgi:cystathionine beta-lyase
MDFDKVINRRNTYSLKWDGASERYQVKGESHLPLWVADMDFKCPDVVIEALKQRAEHGVYGYAGAYIGDFQSAFIQWHAKRYNRQLKAEWLVLSQTVVGSLHRILKTFTEVGDKVILQTPVYSGFHHVIHQQKRGVIYNPLKFTGQTYEMDLEDLERKIDEKTKVLILCNPHNPGGRVWTREELSKLSELCLKHKLLIVSDEVHSDLVYPGFTHTSLMDISKSIAEQSIICASPHKTFNMAGLQISCMIIQNPDLRDRYQEALANDGLTEPNVFALDGFIAAYNQGEEWLEALLNYLEGNRDFIDTYLKQNLPQIQWIKPESTYLAWLDFSQLGLSNQELESMLLEKAKIILNNGKVYGPGFESFFRLNFACPRSILKDGLERLKQALNTL